MKRALNSILVASSLFVMSGPSQALVYTLSGDMDVFQATTNPSNVGSGTGTISGSYDDVSNLLDYTITWADLTSAVTNMHFHLGAPGVPGGVELGIAGPWTSPEVGTGIGLSATQETNLLAGNWYVNVHTSDFPGGEIRGQVLVTPIPVPAAIWLFVSSLGLLGWYRQLADADLKLDEAVYESVRDTGMRNRAIAALLRDYGRL